MVLHEVGIFLIAMFSGYYMVLVGLWDLNVHIVFFCFWDGRAEILSWNGNKANNTRHLHSLDEVCERIVKEVQHE